MANGGVFPPGSFGAVETFSEQLCSFIGPRWAGKCLSRGGVVNLCKLCCHWTEIGFFSISITDILPTTRQPQLGA